MTNNDWVLDVANATPDSKEGWLNRSGGVLMAIASMSPEYFAEHPDEVQGMLRRLVGFMPTEVMVGATLLVMTKQAEMKAKGDQ